MKKPLLSFILLAISTLSFSQQPYYTELPPLPEAVTNNAVSGAIINDTPYVYSFCGLDSTKVWSGIHLKAWRHNLLTGEWLALPPVPDPAGGKIAAAASLLKGLIYVVGGYHVAANGNETSSAKVHRFDPVTNQWLSDAAPLPKAIDDHVQAVWRDSLIFVVTGWSNTQNVPNVQIYNPANNTWQVGTAVPNTNNFKAFGASGVIRGDTLYYCGGAANGANFPATIVLRKGYIHPDNPTQITWSSTVLPEAKGYRMAAGLISGHLIWLGGSDVTYNYDGVAYNGSGGVAALARIKDYDPNNGELLAVNDPVLFPPIMDLRGVAQLSSEFFIIVGGMGPGQQVSRKVYRFSWAYTVEAGNVLPASDVRIFPNPANELLHIESTQPMLVTLTDQYGRLVTQQTGPEIVQLSTENIPAGLYIACIRQANKTSFFRFIIAH